MFTCIRDSFPIFDLIYFEMHDLYIIWLNAFQFSTCKVVFFFVLCLFGATFAVSNWQFFIIYSCVLGG